MKRIGFTLIELLVVIAIIALLAAIIFPAAMRAKDAAYRGSDMSHMNELRSALQLYRVDQGGYPPALFGYVQVYAAPPSNTIPDNQTVDYLFPKRVTSFSTFQPAYDKSGSTDIFPALTVNSCSDPQTNTSDPKACVVWPGSPVTAPTGAACANRAFGSDTPVTSNLVDPTSAPLYYYLRDGYDLAPVKNADGTSHYEIHYSLFWTGYGLGTANCTTGGLPGNISDSPNQLGYANPPDTTVVTWDTYFRDYDSNNQPDNDKRDIVLFIGGNAKMYSSAQVANSPWNVSP